MENKEVIEALKGLLDYEKCDLEERLKCNFDDEINNILKKEIKALEIAIYELERKEFL